MIDDHKLMKLLPRLVVFEQVVEAAGFSAAARQLGLGKAVVSHHIQHLERALGLSLLVRSSRHFAPTDAGRALALRLRPLLAEVRLQIAEVRGLAATPGGLLRVTSPVEFGRSHLAPAVVELQRLHPAVQIEAIVTDGDVNIVAEKIDLALRFGWPGDSTLRARRLGSYDHLLCAAPAYLAAAPPIRAPADLAGHRWLRHLGIDRFDTLGFVGPDGARIEVRRKGTLAANEAGMLVRLATAGAGLALFPAFMVADELARGALVEVLPDHLLPGGDVVAVFPALGQTAPNVQAFVAFLADWLPPRLGRARGRERAARTIADPGRARATLPPA